MLSSLMHDIAKALLAHSYPSHATSLFSQFRTASFAFTCFQRLNLTVQVLLPYHPGLVQWFLVRVKLVVRSVGY